MVGLTKYILMVRFSDILCTSLEEDQKIIKDKLIDGKQL